MALIQCSECGHDVSDKAAACPHCGHPVGGQVKSDRVLNSSVASKIVGMIGGWLIVPWIARLLAMVLFCIVLIVMFMKGRG
jgi:uncharacterized membrane protein YvbJ